jgi:hypothetical protein
MLFKNMSRKDPYQDAADLFGDDSILDMNKNKSNEKNDFKEDSQRISFSNFHEKELDVEEKYIPISMNDLVSMLDLKRDERFSPDFRFHMRRFAVINYKSHNGDDVDECTVFLPEDCVNNLRRLRKELDNYARLYISNE